MEVNAWLKCMTQRAQQTLSLVMPWRSWKAAIFTSRFDWGLFLPWVRSSANDTHAQLDLRSGDGLSLSRTFDYVLLKISLLLWMHVKDHCPAAKALFDEFGYLNLDPSTFSVFWSERTPHGPRPWHTSSWFDKWRGLLWIMSCLYFLSNTLALVSLCQLFDPELYRSPGCCSKCNLAFVMFVSCGEPESVSYLLNSSKGFVFKLPLFFFNHPIYWSLFNRLKTISEVKSALPRFPQ